MFQQGRNRSKPTPYCSLIFRASRPGYMLANSESIHEVGKMFFLCVALLKYSDLEDQVVYFSC